MQYKYCENENFEDLACGRVIMHRAGNTNFPIRLAQEIFGRCVSYLNTPDDLCIYDPCCGGGYLLTVLGFLNRDVIKTILASDIDEEAIQIAQENLSLLNEDGMERRMRRLSELQAAYGKVSHADALDSARRLMAELDRTREVNWQVFKADILSKDALKDCGFKVDLVFVDVPYGNMVAWQGAVACGADDTVAGARVGTGMCQSTLLDNLRPVLKDGAVVAVCSDKSQSFGSDHFRRLEKQMIGKRRFQIFRFEDLS